MVIAVVQKIALTGIKPTGKPHLGNYLGMIRPALELVHDYHALYFIANAHALTTLHDKNILKNYVHEAAATWLALGLNPKRSLIYRQSDVPQIFELTWVYDLLEAAFDPARAEYNYLMAHPGDIDAILCDGAEKARAMAIPMLEKVRQCVGF